MMRRGIRLLTTCYVGLTLGTGGQGTSYAQETLAQAVPAELRTWVAHTAPSRTLPPGTYPGDQLVDVLPPHTAPLIATEAINGTVPTLEVTASRAYKVPISDRVHQLAANGDLDDTTRCGRELPFPGLSPSADRAGLKAIWNLLCRNRGGSFKYLAHDLRGSGPNPHRPLVMNGRQGFGPHGFGAHAKMLDPNELKGNQMMTWLPWERAKDEKFYMYAVEVRRARQGPNIRGERMAGTYMTPEHFFGWEGQYYMYDWVMLGERPVLTVLDSRHMFPQYLPVNRWVPDDQWMLRPAFLVVGKRAHERAASGYVAVWLDTATFEPLWTVFYNEAGSAQDITSITFKWDAEYQRHVVLGQSIVALDAKGNPVDGSVFEAHFCSIQHSPKAQVIASDFNGKLLGKRPFSWGRRPAGCE